MSVQQKESRHCFRCFLEEIDPEAYRRDIKYILDRMEPAEKTSETEYRRRLEVCRNCSYLSMAVCDACGCYVELRAAIRDGRCPYKKWRKGKSE